MEPKKNDNEALWLAIIASLTLGLAPFFPEPHVWGKLRWVLGGANGMKPMDWFDLAMHGAPWIYLGYVLLQKARGITNTSHDPT